MPVDNVDHAFIQSLAIITWLEDTHLDSQLLCVIFDCTWIHALVLPIACEIHPPTNSSVLCFLVNDFGASQAQKFDCYWYLYKLQIDFAKLNRHVVNLYVINLHIVQATPTSEFCFGKQSAVINATLISDTHNAWYFQGRRDKQPNLDTYRCLCDTA
jgi:hypothetical protein